MVYTLRVQRGAARGRSGAVRTARIQRFMLDLFEGGDEAPGRRTACASARCSIAACSRRARSTTNRPCRPSSIARSAGCIKNSGSSIWPTGCCAPRATATARSLARSADDVGESLVALGRLRLQQARFDEAETLIVQGLDMSVAHGPIARGARATAALGEMLEARGRTTGRSW